MRISTEEDDPGYDEFAHLRSITVYFNGYEIGDVLTADEELGYLKRHMTNEKGKCIIDKKTKELKTEERYGIVRVFIND